MMTERRNPHGDRYKRAAVRDTWACRWMLRMLIINFLNVWYRKTYMTNWASGRLLNTPTRLKTWKHGAGDSQTPLRRQGGNTDSQGKREKYVTHVTSKCLLHDPVHAENDSRRNGNMTQRHFRISGFRMYPHQEHWHYYHYHHHHHHCCHVSLCVSSARINLSSILCSNHFQLSFYLSMSPLITVDILRT